MKSTVNRSLEMTSLFEAELLVRLMLWKWNHPHADDSDYAEIVLENASAILRNAAQGEQQLEDVQPENMNLVAAIWYAEHCAMNAEVDPKITDARKAWLAAVRHTLPSCFCDPSDLHES